MTRKLLAAIVGTLAIGAGHSAVCAPLPTFEHFRRVDRQRRESGQTVTAEYLEIIRIDSTLLTRVLEQKPDDAQVIWGAAELTRDQARKRALFKSALRANGSNTVVALRFALAAGFDRDYETATTWFRHCQKSEPDNIVAWVGELWVMQQQGKSVSDFKLPAAATAYRNYTVEAIKTRARVLEAAGYSPYSARRLGFEVETYDLNMVRDLTKPPHDPAVATVMMAAARAMQLGATFFIVELVGQSVEQLILRERPDALTSNEIALRVEAMQMRREDLLEMTRAAGQTAINLATESEMIQYYEDVLAIGEEAALVRLTESVRRNLANPR